MSTTKDEIKKVECCLSSAKERLMRAVIWKEQADVEMRLAQEEWSKWAEKLGSLAYGVNK